MPIAVLLQLANRSNNRLAVHGPFVMNTEAEVVEAI
jgi:redox-sensitive bicupin YhaK (pirin superfamily)